MSVAHSAAISDVAVQGGKAACPACGHAGPARPFLARGVPMRACVGCGTAFMARLPAPADAAAFYDNSYDGATTGYFAKVEKKMHRSRGRMRQLARYVAGGRFLDVGCNGGFMVEAARERGFEAWGVEVDRVSVAYARERYPANRYFHGAIQAFASSAPPFDLVYCSEVIEHVPDVQDFVAAIASVTRPGGVLFVTTPDLAHWRRPRRLEDWEAFNPPSHCILFTPKGLRDLLAAHGFAVIRRKLAWKPGIKFICRHVAD
jgi:SAM-dependent methyltransferase